MVRELLTYLRIETRKHADFHFYDPGILALGTTLCLLILEQLLDANFLPLLAQLVQSTTGLLQFLIGFFIVVPLLVGGMNNKRLGEFMLNVRLKVGADWSRLSRRRYLTALFGYLTWASIVVYFAGTIGLAAASVLGSSAVFTILAWAGFAVFAFATFHLLIVLFNGLRYLSFRLHVPETTQGLVKK